MKPHQVFRPFKFLNFLLNNDIALVLLNQKWFLTSNSKPSQRFLDFFEQLWKKSCFSASVDGGTKTLHSLNKLENFRFIPDLISGDFDSVEMDLLEFYKAKGSEIIRTPDQDYTDFTKCLKILSQKYAENNQLHSIDNILCLIGESDRVDHVLSNLNTLLSSKTYFPTHISVALVSNESCSWMLSPGQTSIELETFDYKKPHWCCLLPIQCPAVVSTTGLKSNFKNQELKIGTFSNFRYEIDYTEDFTVETSKPLVLILPVDFF